MDLCAAVVADALEDLDCLHGRLCDELGNLRSVSIFHRQLHQESSYGLISRLLQKACKHCLGCLRASDFESPRLMVSSL